MADLYAAQAGPWSAFVETDTHTICSASPELFFIRIAEHLECHPMKGTAARGFWPAGRRPAARPCDSRQKTAPKT